MWKQKRTSRRMKNKKIDEAFKDEREEYIERLNKVRQEFKDFCEEREKQYKSEYPNCGQKLDWSEVDGKTQDN